MLENKNGIFQTLHELGIKTTGQSIILNGTKEHFVEYVVDVFGSHHICFGFYDPKYPSPSDPGAYFSYAIAPDRQNWKMTLGNHGWTGGIYRVDTTILVVHLIGVISDAQEVELYTENVGFFSHYKEESPERNREMEARLLTIHGH